MTPAIEAMIQAGRRLCQIAYDAGLPSTAQERLQHAVAAAGVEAMFNPDFAVCFKDALVGFVDTLTPVTSKLDDLAARLQPTRPASVLPGPLVGLRGTRLFQALMALNLPATTPENVHLEVALAAQRFLLHDALRSVTRLYQKFASQGNTALEVDVTMAAFICRRFTLEALVQKHIDLADAAAAAAAAAGPAN